MREEVAMPGRQQTLDVFFKPAEGGYVFRAPSPWVIGRAKHYLVNEVQKIQIQNIKNLQVWMTIVIWLALFALCFGGGSLLLYVVSGHPEPTTIDAVIMMLLAFIGILLPIPLLGYWRLHQLDPIIRTLPPTNERISFREIKEATGKATTAKDHARNSMFAGFVFGLMMLNAGVSLDIAITRGSNIQLVLWSVAALLSGFGMVQNGRLAMRKASESQVPPAAAKS
jgi:hypothetical protein